MLSDNGGSTINRDGKWPGGGSVGRGAVRVGWLGQLGQSGCVLESDVRVCVGRWGRQGGLQRRWRTVPVSKMLLIMPLITNQLANATGPGGLTLAQHVRN